MINKRRLIKNLLAYNDENSFYDKKERLNLKNRRSKAKFIKHICALANANPYNRSFIVVGVEDETNRLKGVPFFDDSRIQSLIDNYLENAPKIQYENIKFSNLPRHKFIGLITIFPSQNIIRLRHNIWEYRARQIFVRRGSTSVAVPELKLDNRNRKIVEDLENQSKNNLEYTLESVLDFMQKHTKEHHPQYKVFQEHFILCWAGKIKKFEDETFYTRVDIELINEQTQLFYSDRDEVKIHVNHDSFIITEYVSLGISKTKNYYPLEKKVLHFKENGSYQIHTEVVFEPPKYSQESIDELLENSNAILKKILNTSNSNNHAVATQLTALLHNYLVCHLYGMEEALHQIAKIKIIIQSMKNKRLYTKYKKVNRIIRKVKKV